MDLRLRLATSWGFPMPTVKGLGTPTRMVRVMRMARVRAIHWRWAIVTGLPMDWPKATLTDFPTQTDSTTGFRLVRR